MVYVLGWGVGGGPRGACGARVFPTPPPPPATLPTPLCARRYWEGKGFVVTLASRLFNLLALLFTLGMSGEGGG